ncbi:MAG: hypothetical protein ACF8R9_10570 [Phycisphaerales bacterium JB054]
MIEYDATVSIEGAATALGVVGAAIGYLINLIVGWCRDRREHKLRGTKLVLLELLESEPVAGLTEEELTRAYASSSTESIRRRYSALKPKKLTPMFLEEKLRSLQFEGMVRPVPGNRWRAELRPLSNFESEDIALQAAMQIGREQLDRTEILEAVKGAVESANDFHEKERAAQIWLRIDPANAIVALQKMSHSDDSEEALVALDILSKLAN